MQNDIGKVIQRLCPLATVVSTYPSSHLGEDVLPAMLRFELPRSLLKLAGGWTHLAPFVKRLRGGALMTTVKPSAYVGGEAKLRLSAECLDDMLCIAEVADFLDAKIGVALAASVFEPTPRTDDLRRRRLNAKLGRDV